MGSVGALAALALVVFWLNRGSDGADSDLRFVDVSADVGLDQRHSAFRWGVSMDPVAMMGGGLCWVDVDDDGWLDLFVTDAWSNGEWGQWQQAGGIPSTRVFRNASGTFVDFTTQWNAGHQVRANGCVSADFDADGHTDIYVTTDRSNLLLWNTGGDGFIEGAGPAGVDAYGWHTGAAAGDVDGDGLLDLVVAGYADLNRARPEASTGFPNTFEPIADVVFVNRGPGGDGRSTFEAVDVGLEPTGPEYGLGVALVDVDADTDLDLLVANDTQPNRVYLNQGVGSDGRLVFDDASAVSGADDPGSGMGVAVGDLNGDASPDLVVTNLEGQGHAALASIGAARFEADAGMQAVHELGLLSTGWGVAFGDLDLDGDLDLLVASGAVPIEDLATAAQPLTYLENVGSVAEPDFLDSSGLVALDAIGALNGRAVALADYDNDGDLDVAVSAIGQPLMLLDNQIRGAGSVTIDPGSPTPGLLAVVAYSDGSSVQRVASAGGSWLSSEDHRVVFGIPDGLHVERVEVTVPGCPSTSFDDVDRGAMLSITPCRG